MSFTPGPWLIADKTFVYALNAEGSNQFSCPVQRGYLADGYITPADELVANANLIAAAPDMFAAIDAADTAFAVLNVQDLGGQARACIREAWPLVQSARAKARPDSGYADAVAEVQQHEIARLDAVVAELRQALGYALEWIDAVPSDAAASFPVMPGFDREWANELLGGGAE